MKHGWRLVTGNHEGRTWQLSTTGKALEAYVYETLPYPHAGPMTAAGVARVFAVNGDYLAWELAESADTTDAGIVALMTATEQALGRLVALAATDGDARA